MHYTFFHIVSIDSGRETERLNDFLQAHSVKSVERQFVADGANSFWSVCVVTHNKSIVAEQRSSSSKRRNSIDYQQELDPEHFTIFDELRGFRNTIAQAHNVAPYAVFTNEQLAKISQLSSITLDALSQLKGIGGKRLEIYAVELLEKMHERVEDA